MNRFLRRWQHLFDWQGNPWYPLGLGSGTMGRLHRLAAQSFMVGRFGRRAWLIKLALSVCWPVRLAFQARPLLIRYGAETSRQHGASLPRQVFDLLALGLGYGLPPLIYYQLRLFLPENRARVGDYLYHSDVVGLFPYLNGFRLDPAVEDKRLFGERCGAARLAGVPLLAWSAGGRVQWGAASWPAGDLISKPAVGCRGEGVVLWRAHGVGRFCSEGQPELDREGLLAWLERQSGDQDWLLQPALTNHPLIADLSPGPLLTVRILTARDRSGYTEAFAAVLNMPVGRQVTNNHGLGAAIDLEQGTLGTACSFRPLQPGFDRHPDTGAPIVGRPLPDWPDIVALALAAHALFPDMRLLGWDVALTPTGPVLLETNASWNVTMPQIASGRPLGETRFPALCERMLNPP